MHLFSSLTVTSPVETLDRLRVEAMDGKRRQMSAERQLVIGVCLLGEGLQLQGAMRGEQLMVVGQQMKVPVGLRDVSIASTHGTRLAAAARPGLCHIAHSA